MAVEEKHQSSVLDQMNEILAEKEKIIDEKLNELKAYEIQLKEFEEQLVAKTNTIKEEQERIDRENAKLDARVKELQEYEANVEKATEKVLAEKTKLAAKSKAQLEEELSTTSLSESNSKLDLDALRESIGLTAESPVAIMKNSVAKGEEEKVKEKKDDKEDNIPELFRKYEQAIEKNCPKWTLIEMLADVYCLSYKDLEIRIFDGELPEVHIVKHHKGAKSDRRLLTEITGTSRVMPEWNITAEDNQVVYVMPFTKETKESLVLKKCQDLIKNHL